MKIDKSNIDQYITGATLRISKVGVTSIEDIPDYITNIFCSNNKLNSLPKLPESLERLWCRGNKLTQLPKLPDSLFELCCGDNKLTIYPDYPRDKQWFTNHNKLLNRIEIINKINDTGNIQ